MPCVGEDFASYQFLATGGTAKRTLPDRLADIINVRDWGAVGNNSTDDNAALQAAVNYAIGPRANGTTGGTVFFPAGSYVNSAPLSCGSSNAAIRVNFVGASRSAVILGNSLSKGSNTFDNIGTVKGLIMNTGSITLSGVGQSVIDCQVAVNASDAIGAYISGCLSFGSSTNTAETGPAPASGPTAGSINFALGSNCVAVDCRGQQADVCYALSGYGPAIIGCSAETNRTGVRAGWAPSITRTTVGTALSGTNVLTFAAALPNSVIVGRYVTGTNIPGSPSLPTTYITAVDNVAFTITLSANITGNITTGVITFDWECPANGCAIVTLEAERNDHTVDLYNVNGAYVSGLITQGQVGSDPGPGPGTFINSITWSNVPPGTAHVTTHAPHNLPAGQQILQLFTDVAGFTPGIVPPYGNPPGNGGSGGFIIATRTGTSTFDYDLPINPSGGFDSTSLYWAYPQYYTLRCRRVHNSYIAGNSLNVNAAFASIDLEYPPPSTRVGGYPVIGGTGEAQHSNNVLAATAIGSVTNTGPFGLQLPTTNPQNLAGWTFIGVVGTVNQLEGHAGWAGVSTTSYADAHMVFASLPGQYSNPSPTVYQLGPFESQEYSITDGAKSGGGAAVWNDIVQGAGSGQYLVRYDGTNWRRIG